MAPEYQLLTDLGFDPRDVYKVGAWFRVPEKAITKKSDGRLFSRDKAAQGGARPVVLAEPWGYPVPNLVFFPRSASSRSGYPHDMHGHRSVFPKCRIGKDGKVLFHIPVTVKASELSAVADGEGQGPRQSNWSCVEPESSGLYAEMERRLRP
ncbi:MAG: hypothetical protein OXK79_01325 [Chloroflexota bacterium]|nr:hypothetical protein [Chloroflexota bacterium]